MYDIQQLFNVSPESQALTDPPRHFTSLPYTVTMTDDIFFRPEINGASPLLYFESTDSELVAHGLLRPCEIPSRARGHSKHHFDGDHYLHGKRMTNGLISLTISYGLVRQRDTSFANLMAELVMPTD